MYCHLKNVSPFQNYFQLKDLTLSNHHRNMLLMEQLVKDLSMCKLKKVLGQLQLNHFNEKSPADAGLLF